MEDIMTMAFDRKTAPTPCGEAIHFVEENIMWNNCKLIDLLPI